MSTLVTHHDGLDRVLRGWDFVIGKRHGRAGVKGSNRSPAVRSPALETTLPATAPAPVAEKAEPLDAPATAAPTNSRQSLYSRLAAAWARRGEDARFEALMREDFRVRNDFLAAKARAEWQDQR